MRRNFWLIAFLFAAFVAPKAHADTCPPSDTCTDYTISFTQLSGTDPLPIGTIVYDGTTLLTTGTIEWQGLVWNLGPNFESTNICLGQGVAPPPLDLFSDCNTTLIQWSFSSGPYPFAYGVPPFGVATMNIETTSGGGEVAIYTPDALPVTQDSGTLWVVGIPVPEPCTSVLLLLGISLSLAIRKHAGIGHPQAS
jgi:hypothetical protein